jgi:hypothetical protein
MRRFTPTGPPPTLGYLQREGLYLQAWCTVCRQFGHDLDPAPLIARFGPAMTLAALTARLRCARCGRRAAETKVAVRNLRMGLRD